MSRGALNQVLYENKKSFELAVMYLVLCIWECSVAERSRGALNQLLYENSNDSSDYFIKWYEL